MKKLLLIRHAKAANPGGVNDFERPLTHTGMQDATAMAQRLHAQNIIPQIIMSSPALRAKATANIFAEHLSVPGIQTNSYIYDSTEETLLHIIDQLPNQYDFIALVGHNPGISQILYYLTGQIKDVPTCAMVVIDFEIDDWKKISVNLGDLVYYDTPNR